MLSSCRVKVTGLTLIFATSGLGLEFFILFLMGFVQTRPDFLLHFLTSVAGLYIGALLLATIVMGLLCSGELSATRRNFIGLAVAWGTLIIQVLFGVSLEFSRSSNTSGAFGDYVIKPLFWVILFGAVPVSILGLLYAKLLKSVLR